MGCILYHWTSDRFQHVVAFSIIIACISILYLNPSNRIAVIFFIHTIFYALPGWALLSSENKKPLLRSLLGLSFLLLAVLFFTHSFCEIFIPKQSYIDFWTILRQITLLAVYCIILISGFSMLLLAKEKSDFDLHEAQVALEKSNYKLEALSHTDGLTGIANRRHFDKVLVQEYARHSRSGAELSLILLDVDYFKAFNDHYGHVKGDECLQQIARLLVNCTTRAADLAARYGGEEFACILPETDLKGAIVIAEKIRQGIQALAIPHTKSSTANGVTASLGVTTVRCTHDQSISDIIVKTDDLLYRAKAAGRNRIEWATAP